MVPLSILRINEGESRMKELTTEEKATAGSIALIALSNAIEKQTIPQMQKCVQAMKKVGEAALKLHLSKYKELNNPLSNLPPDDYELGN